MNDLHEHSFGQDRVRPGERRTLWVIGITAVMMVVEVLAGWLFGSMALLADGLHMASHAAALSITAFAYGYARRHAHDRRFSFGTGKVNALGGFAGAVMLALFALVMAGESVHRLIQPLSIAFNQAILVAVLGLAVNGVSVFLLNVREHHHQHGHAGPSHHHDHNLRSAYLHVMADALTSALAIAALLMGKYLGWAFMDPLMGIVGALLVARWSLGLLRDTGGVLLDRQAPDGLLQRIRQAVEMEGDDRLLDLHAWSIGPGLFAAEMVIESATGKTPSEYRDMIPEDLGLVHHVVEVRARPAAIRREPSEERSGNRR